MSCQLSAALRLVEPLEVYCKVDTRIRYTIAHSRAVDFSEPGSDHSSHKFKPYISELIRAKVSLADIFSPLHLDTKTLSCP
jgi:hypothetical protein